MGYSQKLKLVKPDTAYLKIQAKKGKYNKSLSYLYLEKYYNINSKKRNIQYSEWDKKNICSFSQEFNYGIKYYKWTCKEDGGITETITFPKMDVKEIQRLVNVLFYDPQNNKWVSLLKYEPKDSGAGCYYEIVESNTDIKLKIYCGC